jgi:hypothetical protein
MSVPSPSVNLCSKLDIIFISPQDITEAFIESIPFFVLQIHGKTTGLKTPVWQTCRP